MISLSFINDPFNDLTSYDNMIWNEIGMIWYDKWLIWFDWYDNDMIWYDSTKFRMIWNVAFLDI